MDNNQRFVLIGLGAFGREIAKTLYENDADINHYGPGSKCCQPDEI